MSLHKISTKSKASNHLGLLIYSHEQNELVYGAISRPCIEGQVEQNYLRKYDMTYLINVVILHIQTTSEQIVWYKLQSIFMNVCMYVCLCMHY